MKTLEKNAVLRLNGVELGIIHFCLCSCCSRVLANEIYQKINRINELLAVEQGKESDRGSSRWQAQDL